MAMEVDDSFKRPGAVPFKWEISPGIPKPTSPTPSSTSSATQKLNPPPLRPAFLPPAASPLFLPEVRVRRRSVEQSSAGCFPVPPLNRKVLKTQNHKILLDRIGDTEDEDDDFSDMIADLQTLARWSMSSRKSLSPDSPPLVSSLGRSRRRPHDDPDWAAYGLF